MAIDMSEHSQKEPNAFAAGYAAYKRGKEPHHVNPYKAHQKEWKRWVNGWQTAALEDSAARELPVWALEAGK
jgi:ribosome modulation factor